MQISKSRSSGLFRELTNASHRWHAEWLLVTPPLSVAPHSAALDITLFPGIGSVCFFERFLTDVNEPFPLQYSQHKVYTD